MKFAYADPPYFGLCNQQSMFQQRRDDDFNVETIDLFQSTEERS